MATCKGGATGGVSGALTPQMFNFGTLRFVQVEIYFSLAS